MSWERPMMKKLSYKKFMSNTPVLLLASCLILGHQISSAQSLKDAPTTLRVGNWAVLRTIDPMTDKVDCTGIYKSNFGVQLNSRALYIKISGGIESITLRFGENPPEQTRFPQKIEKDVSTVIVDGIDFSRALETSRIRLQVLTLIKGLTTFDFDVTGIATAVEHIRSDCPIPTATPVAIIASPPSTASPQNADLKSTPITEGLCPENLIPRLRAAGVTEKQIKSACRIN
jgi:hypothetical protein